MTTRASAAHRALQAYKELRLWGNVAAATVALGILTVGFWFLHLRVEKGALDKHDVIIFAIIALTALLIGFANRLPYLAELLRARKGLPK